MGYDLHVTRAEHWSRNERGQIHRDEWKAVVASDPELTPALDAEDRVTWRDTWFEWDGGNISTKSPDDATIRKMVELARKLGATVQGDDGEIYGEDGRPREVEEPGPTLRDRLHALRAWMVWHLWKRWVTEGPYRVGDRVRDLERREGVVVAVDRGRQSFTIRFDDGRVFTYLHFSAGFEIVSRGS